MTTWEMNTRKKVQIETITNMFVRLKFHFDLKLRIKSKLKNIIFSRRPQSARHHVGLELTENRLV